MSLRVFIAFALIPAILLAIVLVLRYRRRLADARRRAEMFADMSRSRVGTKAYYEEVLRAASQEIGHVYITADPTRGTVRAVVRRRDGGYVSLGALARAQAAAEANAPLAIVVTVETA